MAPTPPLVRFAFLAAALLALGGAAAAEEPPPGKAPAPPPAAAERGRVGFQPLPVRGMDPAQREALKVRRETGTVIVVVVPGGPAAKAGLEVGDVLLKYRGKDVPDDSDIVDTESGRAWAEAFQKLGEGTKVGEVVELVVERGGKPVTLSATAVSEADLRALGAPAPAATAPLPPLSGAGAPTTHAESFDVRAEEGLPEGWFPFGGRWRVVPEPGAADAAPKNGVLRQDQPADPWAVLLAAGPGRAYADGTVSVRFLPVSGEEDASGGIVFRAQDARNYYFARGNALEGNLRIYRVKDGVRGTLASADVRAPERGRWHTLEVTFTGGALRATMDGKDVVEAKDESFASGWAGLWTKADSVTLFDDWRATPAPKPDPRR